MSAAQECPDWMEPVPVHSSHVLDWARHNKVAVEGMDGAAVLAAVNAARAGLGLPPFVVTKFLGPVEQMPAPELGGTDPYKLQYEKKYRARVRALRAGM